MLLGKYVLTSVSVLSKEMRMITQLFCRASSLVSLEPEYRNALMLSIDKWNLDDAHKDKQNKIYPPNFKVKLINHLAT
jgi:hypothetical protein